MVDMVCENPFVLHPVFLTGAANAGSPGGQLPFHHREEAVLGRQAAVLPTAPQPKAQPCFHEVPQPLSPREKV